MQAALKQVVQNTSLYHPLRNLIVKRRQQQELGAWERKGKPAPPPHVIKQQTLQSYAEKYGLKVLVETGTDTPDRGHVIIIDDARCFGSYPDYPSIEQLNEFIKLKRPNMDISVQYDSVRIAPKM